MVCSTACHGMPWREMLAPPDGPACRARMRTATAGASDCDERVRIWRRLGAHDREELGELITRWLESQSGKIKLVDKVVTQSSDNEYHCVTVVLFYDKLR